MESAPHIYVSAIAFTPSSSKLFSDIRRPFRKMAVPLSGVPSNWLAASPVMSILPQKVLSLAFSPDGQFLVSGSDRGTLQFWDVKKGTAIGEPLGSTLR